MNKLLLLIGLLCAVNAAFALSRPKGVLDVATDTHAAGWTCDADNFRRALTVRIYIDGKLVATTRANNLREEAVGDQCGGFRRHGFDAMFDQETVAMLRDGKRHTVRAYAVDIPTGRRFELQNSPMRIGPFNPEPKGFLDTATTDSASGWACDESDTSRSLKVRILVDGVRVATVLANRRREQAVADECGGNPRHGWSVDFSDRVRRLLRDGNKHEVRALALDIPTGRPVELSGSPKTVQAERPRPRRQPKGFLDVATATRVAGWTCDPTDYSQPLMINIYVDDMLVDTRLARMQREEAVGAECGGNRNHGFDVRFDEDITNLLSDGNPHQVSVKARDIPSGRLIELQGSPKVVEV